VLFASRRNTVPSLSIAGRKLTGSREIDRIPSDPPLYPSEPEPRVAVEDADRWGEEILQPAVRRILWNALKRNRSPLASYAEGARLGVPIGLAVRTAAPVVGAANRINRADEDVVRRDLASLPGALKRIDDWIAEGVLGSDSPSAADLQIAASLRLAMTLDDLRPAIAGRPAGELAVRAIPESPAGHPPSYRRVGWSRCATRRPRHPPADDGRIRLKRADTADALPGAQTFERVPEPRSIR
jgi:glutathione S-transferase